MSEHEDHFEDDDHGGHEEEGEPWLVSYADLMTLLFGFFVLMYTFAAAKVPDDSMLSIRKELATFFGGEYALPLKNVAEEFKSSVEGTGIEKNLDVKLAPEGLEMIMRSKVLFLPGRAELHSSARKAFEHLAKVIVARQEKDKTEYVIYFEGHTDSDPVSAKNIFPSNWELSAARASSVLRVFEGKGYSPKQMVALGYGSSRPQDRTNFPEGKEESFYQALDRRVVVRIQTKSSPLNVLR